MRDTETKQKWVRERETERKKEIEKRENIYSFIKKFHKKEWIKGESISYLDKKISLKEPR